MRRTLLVCSLLICACQGEISDLSQPGFSPPPKEPPAAPTQLRAQAISAFEVELTWVDASSDENRFVIERSTVEAGPYARVGEAAADATSLVDRGLSDLTTYHYRVFAENEAGVSATVTASVQTPRDPSIPSRPEKVMASVVQATTVQLSWSAATMGEVSGYRIYLRDVPIAETKETMYTDRFLAAGQQYCYVIRGFNSARKEGDPSEKVCATTGVAGVPSDPGGLKAQAVSDSQIDLTWMDNSSNEMGFKLERALNATGPWTEIRTVNADATSASDTGLNAMTVYYYRVRAFNEVGQSGYSDVVSEATR